MARGQGHGQKIFEAKTKGSLSEDRHSRRQRQECSKPRPRTKNTGASVLRKIKQNFQKIFSRDLQMGK